MLTPRPCANSTGATRGSLRAPRPAPLVFAESTQDVADAVKLASQYEVPVIPYGAGSSLEGHLLAVQGGISIDVSRMNRVLSINRRPRHGTARHHAQAAPTKDRDTPACSSHRPRRRRQQWRHGATRASGTTPCATAPSRERVGLEVVTASGEVIRTEHTGQKRAVRLRPHAPDGGQRWRWA